MRTLVTRTLVTRALATRSLGCMLALAPMLALSGSPAAAQGQSGACFYEHANFQGRRMCVHAGQRVPVVDPSLNDHLSSVQVQPGLRITICEHANFAGRCIPVERSIANLNEIGLDDKISSVVVEPLHTGPVRSSGPGRPLFDGPGQLRALESPRPQSGSPTQPRAPSMGDPPLPHGFDDARQHISDLRVACEAGERRACIQFGIALGRNWDRRNQWRQDNPEFFTWER